MSKPFIRVGDTHSHGGQVVAGAPNSNADGKAIARVGDPAICQIHGPTTIVTGDSNVEYDGQFVAREGDKLACGASLIASQAKTGSL
jgi:uncharacterized Zn-binding protein involved in type VI secretion